MPDAAFDAGVDREATLTFAREAAFSYGVWNRFKALYKAVEADPHGDLSLTGALLARIDDAAFSQGIPDPVLSLSGITNVRGIAAVGDYLLVLGGRSYWEMPRLEVVANNPDDPMHPRPVASLELESAGPATFTGMALCGSLLCFGMQGRGELRLHVIDVSDPRNPRPRGTVTLPASTTILGGETTAPLLYLSVQKSNRQPFPGIRILDLSQNEGGESVGDVRLEGIERGAGIAAVGDRLLAVITRPVGFNLQFQPTASGLHLLDVSTPGNASRAGFLALETPRCVAMHGRTVYVGFYSNVAANNGLAVIDASDPRRPQMVAFLAINGVVNDLTLSTDGQRLYASTYNETRIIDVSIPAAPRSLSTVGRLTASPKMVTVGDLTFGISQTGVAAFHFTHSESPQRVGGSPGVDTIGYMKRRGRRFLRGLAKSDPARYAEAATEFLLALGAGKQTTLDPARHWAAIDVLFGGGKRFRQTKHGRGRYIATGQPVSRLSLRTREERSPDAWDARPAPLVRLLQSPGLLPPVYTFAARALRANKQPLPPLTDLVLEQWLAGSEPLLIALGVRMATGRLLAGEMLAPTLAADAFFSAGATTRRRLAAEKGSTWAGKRTWAEPFALRLAARLAQPDARQTGLSKRQADAAGLLTRYFTWALSPRPDVLLPLVAAFLGAERDDLQALIVAGASNVPLAALLPWLTQLGRVGDAVRREPTLAALTGTLKGVALNRAALRGFVFSADAFVRVAGWRLIAASATGGDLLRVLWTELLQSPQVNPALATAMASADALGLLERACIGSVELTGYLSDRPFLVNLLSPEAFGAVASQAPASVVLSLVAASPDERWALLRSVLLRQLREGIGLESLWLAAEDALASDATGRLEARLLGDAEIAETLLAVGDARVMAIRDPSFGPILGAWLNRYADRFTANSALLYDAATHPLPEVRTPALAWVRERGMNMPFALRLVESALPPSVAVGRSFFDAEPPGGAREADYALALCDSPKAEVREVGRDYVSARWATLPHERILSALFENPDPAMQAFVAERLDDAEGGALDAVPTFDAEVLRTTNRARVAKERIKTRQTAQSSVDVATLLTVARGRTPRDAEWALGELARRALRGETIEGVLVEGVMGV